MEEMNLPPLPPMLAALVNEEAYIEPSLIDRDNSRTATATTASIQDVASPSDIYVGLRLPQPGEKITYTSRDRVCSAVEIRWLNPIGWIFYIETNSGDYVWVRSVEVVNSDYDWVEVDAPPSP
jgi:hypothetical protein